MAKHIPHSLIHWRINIFYFCCLNFVGKFFIFLKRKLTSIKKKWYQKIQTHFLNAIFFSTKPSVAIRVFWVDYISIWENSAWITWLTQNTSKNICITVCITLVYQFITVVYQLSHTCTIRNNNFQQIHFISPHSRPIFHIFIILFTFSFFLTKKKNV